VVEARISRSECRSKTGNHAALFGGYSGECGPRQPLGSAARHHGTRRAIERSGGECADWRDIARPCFRSGHGEARDRERVGASFCESPPIPIEARFRNEGTVHEAPQGTIEVRNLFGSVVATGTLPVRNVLPGVVRRIGTSVGEGVWLGQYTVYLRAKYGDAGQELYSQENIWVVPWRTQGWKVLLGLGFVLWVIIARRRFRAFWIVLKTGLPPPKDY